MAVDRVERRLRRVTAALDAAGIRYAVVGGNAVAAWVARVDPGATRATKDVDLLVERSDLEAITSTIQGLGFERQDLRSLVRFIDPDEPSRRSGVHLVWADELVRPSYACPAPSMTEAVQDPEGFWVLDLPALVRMKLTSNRDIDRAHVGDMLSVGLLTDAFDEVLPAVLRERLAEIRRSLEDDDLR
ncbi:MAG: nucleotidyltransferase family protein [Phycisphaerae bacterium]|nr:nucleotidyltransferase family protein [Phycisphaerae bacterium]